MNNKIMHLTHVISATYPRMNPCTKRIILGYMISQNIDLDSIVTVESDDRSELFVATASFTINGVRYGYFM